MNEEKITEDESIKMSKSYEAFGIAGIVINAINVINFMLFFQPPKRLYFEFFSVIGLTISIIATKEDSKKLGIVGLIIAILGNIDFWALIVNVIY